MSSEREFQRALLEYAHFCGWKTAHFDASVRIVKSAGQTRHVGDRGSTGFPDLVLLREDRLVFAELKTDTGTLSVAQREWIASLEACVRASTIHEADRYFQPFEVYVWRPRDWGEIEVVLR